jgi:hypothetical protein
MAGQSTSNCRLARSRLLRMRAMIGCSSPSSRSPACWTRRSRSSWALVKTSPVTSPISVSRTMLRATCCGWAELGGRPRPICHMLAVPIELAIWPQCLAFWRSGVLPRGRGRSRAPRGIAGSRVVLRGRIAGSQRAGGRRVPRPVGALCGRRFSLLARTCCESGRPIPPGMQEILHP